MNKDSGFQGLAGHSDLRAVMKDKAAGSERADLALQVSICVGCVVTISHDK